MNDIIYNGLMQPVGRVTDKGIEPVVTSIEDFEENGEVTRLIHYSDGTTVTVLE